MMENQPSTTVTIKPNGPALIAGTFTFIDKDGKEATKEGTIAICRCGLSANKPFCDGAHRNSTVLINH
ncbi:MAG: hypothetical protein RIQ89_1117 [Bacteroidota bacterium]|jgi:CDGSH-type Zn-finger protein